MSPQSVGAAHEGFAHADPHTTWDITLQTPPTEFYPKYGPLPAVVSVKGQPPTWDAVGYTRTLGLSDGGSVLEEITDCTRGLFFGYTLTKFDRLFGRLISGAHAEWTFTAEGDGTRIRWTYNFYPLPGRGLIVSAIVNIFWTRYMRHILPAIIGRVDDAAAAH